ncbi:hypothetical protein KKF59_03835 [Patescibacteria group bacterium]|nr:hypothetical protein [Patescibacteria group bacterium]MBU1034607.1 hypothetical protein [Patescibacteria group bacterium]MBU1629467.1 hypothetical protein [Patescibacteria group bacterium]MBU1908225.1 hypothetical protein [Patescibacteria group bacterium]
MFISVVPVKRTPYGVDCFDYKIGHEAGDVRVGDLIQVPFRNRQTPALVISTSEHSEFAAKTINLNKINLIFNLPAVIVPFLYCEAQRAFSSKPSVLLSWMRTVPKRQHEKLTPTPLNHLRNGSDIATYAINRFEKIRRYTESSNGRVLILTPWKNRATSIAHHLSAPFLHADLNDTAAWKTWTEFVATKKSTLVATRLGAWLSIFADTVIIDEPENDDFKQDELSPRLDARQLVESAKEYRTNLQIIKVGTTCRLREIENVAAQNLPSIQIPITYVAWNSKGRSQIEGLQVQTLSAIENAINEKRRVIILHPIKGETARVTCRDCAWTLTCQNCGFAVTRGQASAICGRCGQKTVLPAVCANCKGSALAGGRTGKDRLIRNLAGIFPTNAFSVLDLKEWHNHSLAHEALVIITDLSLIGGVAEDIRRRERLILAYRRLAAAVQNAGGKMLVQGDEELIETADSWLQSDGLLKALQAEWKERKTFKYPPAYKLIKLLIDGTAEKADELFARLTAALPLPWETRGPFKVAYRGKGRKERFVIHALPPTGQKESGISLNLEAFAKEAIIDLDPIAFFM